MTEITAAKTLQTLLYDISYLLLSILCYAQDVFRSHLICSAVWLHLVSDFPNTVLLCLQNKHHAKILQPHIKRLRTAAS